MEGRQLNRAGNWLLGAGCLLPVVLVIGIALFGARHNPSAEHPDYPAKMAALVERLSSDGASVTWPSHGDQAMMRIDLPARVHGRAAHWDADSERRLAEDARAGFVRARREAGVTAPTDCIVHVYDDTGREVAHANALGAGN